MVTDKRFLPKARPIPEPKYSGGDYSLIHTGARFGNNCTIGLWCVVEDDVSVGDNVEIGSFVELRSGTTIKDNCKIDSYVVTSGDCLIESGAVLRYGVVIARGVTVESGAFLSPGVKTCFSDADGNERPGIIIGRGAFIGTGAVIGPDVIIAPGVKIGANSFVNRHCLKSGTYVGNPARLIDPKERSRDPNQ